MIIRLSIIAAAAAVSALQPEIAAAETRMRIALDTPPAHIRNVTVGRFVEELEARAPGVFDVEVQHSAQAGKDVNLPRLMRQGGVEMAIPGNMLLDSYEPNVAINQIPVFYGLSADDVHAVIDGEVGQEINQRIEKAINVHVLTPWLDLGPLHTFGTTNRPIRSYDEMKGAKIRHPGGAPNNFRFSALGAIPEVIPFSDVPLALTQGRIDGVQTSFESAYRTKLIDAGLTTAFTDAQWFGMYVPIVAGDFWNGLSESERSSLSEAWAVAAEEERATAARAQDEAQSALSKLGMEIVTPLPADLAEKRAMMIEQQARLVKELGLDPELVEKSKAILNGR